MDSLEVVRTKIANTLRNLGYYYFRPEYIEYLADSLITPHAVALRVSLADNVPELARRQYRVGDVYTYVLRRSTKNLYNLRLFRILSAFQGIRHS